MGVVFAMLRFRTAGDFACQVGDVNDMYRTGPHQTLGLMRGEDVVDGVDPCRQRDFCATRQTQHAVTDSASLKQDQRRS